MAKKTNRVDDRGDHGDEKRDDKPRAPRISGDTTASLAKSWRRLALDIEDRVPRGPGRRPLTAGVLTELAALYFLSRGADVATELANAMVPILEAIERGEWEVDGTGVLVFGVGRAGGSSEVMPPKGNRSNSRDKRRDGQREAAGADDPVVADHAPARLS